MQCFHLTGTVGWMKKTSKHTQFLCNVPGCISRSQYMRGMVRLAGKRGKSGRTGGRTGEGGGGREGASKGGKQTCADTHVQTRTCSEHRF